jgi:DNA modification methylase
MYAYSQFNPETGAERQMSTEQPAAANTADDSMGSQPIWMGHQLEYVAVSRLKPYPANARTHSRKQIRQIAESLKRFGFINPPLVDDHDVIIAGHGRIAAAKQLDLKTVPILRLAHLSAAEKRAYILADNKLAEQAGWDREILALELQALIDLDFAVELTGFQMGEIDIILAEAAEAKGENADREDEFDASLPGPAVTQRGDLWTLGNHRLLCGNALDPTTYDLLLEGKKAEFVFADPPFNVPVDGHVCGKGAIHHREFAMASGEMSPEAFTAFLTEVFQQLAAQTVDGSIHQVCMDWRHVAEMMAAGGKAYTELKNICVWAKTNVGMGSFYRSQHELIFVWKSGAAPHVNNIELGQHGRNRSNVWTYAGVNTMRRGRLEELAMHPTVKPIGLVADAIKDCSRRGGLVLDPFCGSGTTLIAAERTGRKARTLEIDATYVDVAVRRWQRYAGKTAVLEATGQTFEQVEEERSVIALSAVSSNRQHLAAKDAH